MNSVKKPVRISRGNLRRVALRDLPENDSVIDKKDTLNFAIRWELSPELPNNQTGVRYLDCLVWLKPIPSLKFSLAVLSPSDIIDLASTWYDQIVGIALQEQYAVIGGELDIVEYENSININKPASVTKSISELRYGNGPTIIDAVEDRTKDVVRLYTPKGEGHCGSIVVWANATRTMYCPVGMEAWIDLPESVKLRPTPRESLRQGKLTIAKVKEPLQKVGPYGWRVIVCGNLSGCSAMLIISDEFDVNDWEQLHVINRELNFQWSNVYENATLTIVEFEHLVKATNFKLRRPYYQTTLRGIKSLVDKAMSLDLMDWKYPTIKFNPVQHMDKAGVEFPKMRLSELTEVQRQDLEMNLVNLIPTVDWPEEGDEVTVPTQFGDVTLSYPEWESILNGYSVG